MPIGKRRLPAKTCAAIVRTAALHGDISSGHRVCYEGYDDIIVQLTSGDLDIDDIAADLAVGMLVQLPTGVVRAATASKRNTVATAAVTELASRGSDIGDSEQRTEAAIRRTRNKPAALIRALVRDQAPVNVHAAKIICAGHIDDFHSETYRTLLKAFDKGLTFTPQAARHIAEHCGSTIRKLLYANYALSGADMREHIDKITVDEAVMYFEHEHDDTFLSELFVRLAHTNSGQPDYHGLHRVPGRWIDACGDDIARQALLSLCSHHGLSILVAEGHPFIQNTSQRQQVIDKKLSNPKHFWGAYWERAWIEKLTIENVAQLELISDVIDRLHGVPAAELLAETTWTYGITHKMIAKGLTPQQQHIAFMLMEGDISVNDAIAVATTMGHN